MKLWVRPAFLLGFAVGGFFDGVLLHQILQWHHLLSLLPGVASLREQVLWDGLFHAFMYVAAVIGLAGLWRARAPLGEARWQAFAGALLIGFGGWHIADSLVSHWWLGIHRIRIDSPDPLKWDLIWLGLFGILPVAAGWPLLRRTPPPGAGMHAEASVLLMALATSVLAAWSLRPPPAERLTTIVFAPWVDGGEAIAAVSAAGGRLVWTDPALAVMVVHVPHRKRVGFYANGALLVNGGGLPTGCIGWSRPAP